jgi:cbb3-type cytochrome oxidase maturation protein
MGGELRKLLKNESLALRLHAPWGSASSPPDTLPHAIQAIDSHHSQFSIFNSPLSIMSIIYLLIGCSITIALLFLVGFLWSIRSGQYDDTYTPAVRMLFEPDPITPDDPKQNPLTDSSQTKP